MPLCVQMMDSPLKPVRQMSWVFVLGDGVFPLLFNFPSFKMRFIEQYNFMAKPFKWTYKDVPLAA